MLRLRALLPLLLAGCASTVTVPDGRVSPRGRGSGEDQALVLIFRDPTLCSITLRDEDGRLADLEERDGVRRRVDMTRPTPHAPWKPYTNGVTLLLVEAMTPGHYSLRGYSTGGDVDYHHAATGELLATTDCAQEPTFHDAYVPFEIRRGEIRLLALPGGPPSLDDISGLRSALGQPYVRDPAASWLPAIEDAATTAHRELVAAQRQPHDGYDVYPDCDHTTAVVRTTGTPFAFVQAYTAEARDSFRARAMGVAPRSRHADGFGGGCATGQRGWVIYMTNASEVDEARRKIGEWLVREDLAGEVDLMVTSVFRLH
jgi:hypothetical protein